MQMPFKLSEQPHWKLAPSTVLRCAAAVLHCPVNLRASPLLQTHAEHIWAAALTGKWKIE
jgi:hypothetical protein